METEMKVQVCRMSLLGSADARQVEMGVEEITIGTDKLIEGTKAKGCGKGVCIAVSSNAKWTNDESKGNFFAARGVYSRCD